MVKLQQFFLHGAASLTAVLLHRQGPSRRQIYLGVYLTKLRYPHTSVHAGLLHTMPLSIKYNTTTPFISMIQCMLPSLPAVKRQNIDNDTDQHGLANRHALDDHKSNTAWPSRIGQWLSERWSTCTCRQLAHRLQCYAYKHLYRQASRSRRCQTRSVMDHGAQAAMVDLKASWNMYMGICNCRRFLRSLLRMRDKRHRTAARA